MPEGGVGSDGLQADVVWRGVTTRVLVPRVPTAATIIAAAAAQRGDVSKDALAAHPLAVVWRGRRYMGGEILVDLHEHARLLLFGATTAEVAALAAAAAAVRVRNDLVIPAPAPRARRRAALPGSGFDGGPRFGFGSISTLPGYADARDARRCLRAVARHPGVLAVMKKNGWFCPVLSELAPDGKVGVDPVCVLGLNVNSGAEIKLRIRTDDERGFRKFGVIMETVYHELAHNAISEHSAAFYALVSALKREGEAHDWRTSGGRVLGGPRAIAPSGWSDRDGDSSDSSGSDGAATTYEGGEGVLGGAATGASRLLTAVPAMPVAVREGLAVAGDDLAAARAVEVPRSLTATAGVADVTGEGDVARVVTGVADAASAAAGAAGPARPPTTTAAAVATTDPPPPDDVLDDGFVAAGFDDATAAFRSALGAHLEELSRTAPDAVRALEGVVGRARSGEARFLRVRRAALAERTHNAAPARAFLVSAGFREEPEHLALPSTHDAVRLYLAHEVLKQKLTQP